VRLAGTGEVPPPAWITKSDPVTWWTGSSNLATAGERRRAGGRIVPEGGVSSENSAVTVRPLVMPTVHVSSHPEHAPLQLENCEPVWGVAVSVTEMFAAKAAEHDEPALPQLIRFGELVTEPTPSPETDAERL